MSHGTITRASRRHSRVRRRTSRYGATLAGRSPRTLPPQLLPQITGRRRSNGNRTRWILVGVQLLVLTLFVGFATMIVSTIAGVSGTMAAYKEVNDNLPNAALIAADTFQSTRILDRNGKLLQEIDDPNAGWRTFVPLDKVAPDLIDATVAAEDATFWTHRGVEPFAIVRGFTINLTGAGSSGASTITQQLVRSLYTEIGNEYSYKRKGKEALAAVAVERKYSKHDIMTMYVNQIFYGERSYGIEAAAQTFFDKHASELDLAESALLAGLPQRPSDYDPVYNFELAKQRQKYVLQQMTQHGYITKAEADAAFQEDLQSRLRDNRTNAIQDSPHFVTYVRKYLVDTYGDDILTRGGLTITTTLDPDVQDRAEQIVADQVVNLAAYNASNAALTAMVPWSGEILAMVGSANFDNALIEGQNNIMTSDQQPGSAIKPIVYAAAFENGWNPATVIMDTTYVRETPNGVDEFGNPSPYYIPNNYTGQFYGAVPARIALSNSLNIPALKAVEHVGVANFIDFAHRVGFRTSLTRDPSDYGSAIALGAGEVKPLELVNAYATIANNGKYVPANPILKIEDSQGNVLYELDHKTVLQKAEQVIQPEHAYQVTSILTDNQARSMIFSSQNLFGQTQDQLRRPTAAKSGTTNEWKDIWTMGYTTDLVIGVWVGNTNNEPLKEIDGIQGAGPIWSTLMKVMHQTPEFARLLVGPDGQDVPHDFPRPPGITEAPICAATGHKATQQSGNKREILARGDGPDLRCDQLSAYERAELEAAMKDIRANGGKYVGGAAESINRYAQAAGYQYQGGTTTGYFGYPPPIDPRLGPNQGP